MRAEPGYRPAPPGQTDERPAGYPPLPARLVQVPFLEVEVSAGGGFDYVAEDTTAGWPFDWSLLGTIHDGAPDDLRLVIVRGSSMIPLLKDGDMLPVNTADTQPSPPGIFVLFDDIRPMVKTLGLLPGSSTVEPLVRISSDNTHY
ncbi:hypothetical protein HIMB100_00013690 [SAR116 cluster alpha proteobacterium HIMB100]|nr:hypothetical protein HIMB100_00013690 [SAR116 cluster alpha proteobacterium HIMB100]